MNLPKFFAELKRRHVYRAAVAYAMVAQLPSLLSPRSYAQTAYISKMFAPAPEPAKT